MSLSIDRLGTLWLDIGFGAFVLFSIAGMVMLGCRQPVRRIAVARAAIVGSLLIIPMAWFHVGPRVELITALRDSRWLRAHPILSLPGRAHRSTAADAEQNEYSTDADVATHWALVREIGRSCRFITAGYFCVVGLGLGGLLLGYAGLFWLTTRSGEPSPVVLEIYRTLAARRRVRPRLRIATRIRRPVLVGLIRQTILIPAELEWPEAEGQLRLSLLHELAHAERCDPWFGLASGLAQSFWYVLPPFWWIRAQLRLDQEFLADHRAADAFRTPHAYASSLLDFAAPGPSSESEETPPAAAKGRSASALFFRVLMLVQCPFRIETCPPRWWHSVVLSAAALGTLAASSLSLKVSEASPNPDPAVASSSAPGHAFRLARLAMNPELERRQGQGSIFELPLRLPNAFDLALEVWGDDESLAQTRVAGHRLGLGCAGENPSKTEQWHRVFLHRGARGLLLVVDGRKRAIDPKVNTTTWLSVEPPPGRPAEFRNLILSW